MSDRSPEEPPDVELQLQRLLERNGAVGVDYIPRLQHHPTLYRSPYHLPELDPLYDPYSPMSGKQDSEELWGVCAFRLVGTFAFALSILPFAA